MPSRLSLTPVPRLTAPSPRPPVEVEAPHAAAKADAGEVPLQHVEPSVRADVGARREGRLPRRGSVNGDVPGAVAEAVDRERPVGAPRPLGDGVERAVRPDRQRLQRASSFCSSAKSRMRGSTRGRPCRRPAPHPRLASRRRRRRRRPAPPRALRCRPRRERSSVPSSSIRAAASSHRPSPTSLPFSRRAGRGSRMARSPRATKPVPSVRHTSMRRNAADAAAAVGPVDSARPRSRGVERAGGADAAARLAASAARRIRIRRSVAGQDADALARQVGHPQLAPRRRRGVVRVGRRRVQDVGHPPAPRRSRPRRDGVLRLAGHRRAGSAGGHGSGSCAVPAAAAWAASCGRRVSALHIATLAPGKMKIRCTRGSWAARRTIAMCCGVQAPLTKAPRVAVHADRRQALALAPRTGSGACGGSIQMSASSPIWWLAWPVSIGPPRGWLMSPT